jgi:hypothetical protein
MTDQGQRLFTMIDNARVDNGCARLGRETALTKSARSHAGREAGQNSTQTDDGTEAIADANSPQAAYNRMMNRYSGALLDCGRTGLGIGYAQAEIDGTCIWPLPCIGSSTERRWVADFD